MQARQPLLVLEAMKMETPLVAPYEAVVRRVHVAEGDRVAGGALLVELEEPAEANAARSAPAASASASLALSITAGMRKKPWIMPS